MAVCSCRLFYTQRSHAAAHGPDYEDPGETESVSTIELISSFVAFVTAILLSPFFIVVDLKYLLNTPSWCGISL